MKTTHSPGSRPLRSFLPLIAGLAVSAFGSAQGAVTVDSNVVFNSTTQLYTYFYTVSNSGTSFDLATIDIPIGPGVSLLNLLAPAGFGILSDGDPVNLVTFFEDTDPGTLQTFAPDSTSAAFSYDAAVAPSVVTFSALDANGDTYTGVTFSAVPEPSVPMLAAALALPLLGLRRRVRRQS